MFTNKVVQIAFTAFIVASCNRGAHPRSKYHPGKGIINRARAMALLTKIGVNRKLVEVRSATGQIPGTSGGGGDDAVHVLLYSADSLRAALLTLVWDGDGRLTVLEMAEFRKSGDIWETVEANGGLATYGALAKYASNLDHSRPKRYARLDNCN